MRFRRRGRPGPYGPTPQVHPDPRVRPGYPPPSAARPPYVHPTVRRDSRTRPYGNRTRLAIPTLGLPPLLVAASRVLIGVIGVGLVVLWYEIIKANGLGFGMDEAGLMLVVLLVCGLLAKSARELPRGRSWSRRVSTVTSATIAVFCLVSGLSTYEGAARFLALTMAAAASSVIVLLYLHSRR